MKKIVQISAVILTVVCLIGLVGCTKRNEKRHSNTVGQTTAQQKDESNTQTGVVSKINETLKQITISDVSNGWTTTVIYDTDTEVLSRYGETISPTQIEVGQILDVQMGEQQHAKKIQVSYDAWQYESVSGLTYNQSDNTISIMGETYNYTSNLVLYNKTAERSSGEKGILLPKKESGSDGKKAATTAEETSDKDTKEKDSSSTTEQARLATDIFLSEISSQDVVTCWGYKGKICSVIVEAGHGYVRLSHYDSFIGGTICIGSIIAPVEKDMVLTVPVGNWTLEIDKDGKTGKKDIVVAQEQDQTVDLSNLVIVRSQRGILHFILTPANATIYIDGEEYNGRTDFMVDFGKHKISVVAVGYKAYNGTIDLQSAYINVTVDLIKLDSDEESTASTSATTKGAPTTTGMSATTTAIENTAADSATFNTVTAATTTEDASASTTSTTQSTTEATTVQAVG